MSETLWGPNMATESEAAMCGGMNCPDKPYSDDIEIAFLVIYLLGMSYVGTLAYLS